MVMRCFENKFMKKVLKRRLWRDCLPAWQDMAEAEARLVITKRLHQNAKSTLDDSPSIKFCKPFKRPLHSSSLVATAPEILRSLVDVYAGNLQPALPYMKVQYVITQRRRSFYNVRQMCLCGGTKSEFYAVVSQNFDSFSGFSSCQVLR